MELGHRLKLFRVASELKQAELADHLGVSKNYVYMVESGRREPSQSYLKKFAKAVNIPLSVIFLESAGPKDAKSRKLIQNILALMAEYAESTGVKRSQT